MRATAAFLLVLGYLGTSHAWKCNDITLRNVNQIDAGLGQVVATDKSRHAYFLSGTTWQRLPYAALKHITVGPAGIWGIRYNDYIYKYVAGNWARTSGSLKQVDAGGNAFIVGASGSDRPYCVRSSFTVGFKPGSTITWTRMPGAVKYYSCGPFGCWAVNRNNNAFLMKSVTPTTCANSNWQYISGLKLIMVEVGTDGTVFGVTTAGKVYSRVGISASRPQGTGWTHIDICLATKHVTYDLGRLWVVSKGGIGMVCTH